MSRYERGSSFVELALFVPLAFLAICGGTDLALYFLARAEIDDLMRSLSKQTAYEQSKHSFVKLSRDLVFEPDWNQISAVSTVIAESVQHTSLSYLRDPQVQIYQVLLSIDPLTGAFTGRYELKHTSSSSARWASNALDGLLSEFSAEGVSRFAISSGLGTESPQFLEWSPVLVLELRGHAPQMYSSRFQSASADDFTFSKLYSVPIRVGLR